MLNTTQKIKQRNSSIEENDKALADEMQTKRNQYYDEKLTFEGTDNTDASSSEDLDFALESIILSEGRPVLDIFNGDTILNFKDVESETWRERLTQSHQVLTSAIKSVGRIELKHDPRFEWVGTGWLVDQDIIVTNRHVAEIFGRNKGSEFVFKQGVEGKEVEGYIDLLEEIRNNNSLIFKIKSILNIEKPSGPDIAFLRVEVLSSQVLPSPIKLADFEPINFTQVAAIGYPARDSRIPDQDLMLRIFGDVYNKKKLAPGRITSVSQHELTHDCSTLGGNSGSVILDLNSGKALGLHFAGKFLQNNWAVPAAIIKQRLDRIENRHKS